MAPQTFIDNLQDYLNTVDSDTLANAVYVLLSSEELSAREADKLYPILKSRYLYDFDKIQVLVNNENFEIRKRGLHAAAFNKTGYDEADIERFKKLSAQVEASNIERGKRVMKKQMLSSKEKEHWVCECGKTNDMESNCIGCAKDIYGFTNSDMSAGKLINILTVRIELLHELLK